MQRTWAKKEKKKDTKLLVSVWLRCVPTCMFVVGRGLWSLCAAALLEEEGGSFDHEEALAEAGGRKEEERKADCQS